MFKGRIETNATNATKNNFNHYCTWIKSKTLDYLKTYKLN